MFDPKTRPVLSFRDISAIDDAITMALYQYDDGYDLTEEERYERESLLIARVKIDRAYRRLSKIVEDEYVGS